MHKYPLTEPENGVIDLEALGDEGIRRLIEEISERTSQSTISSLITHVSLALYEQRTRDDEFELLIIFWEKLLSVAPATAAFNASLNFMISENPAPERLKSELNSRRVNAIRSYRKRVTEAGEQKIKPAVSEGGKSYEEKIGEMLNISPEVVEIADFQSTLFSYFRLRGARFSLLPGWQKAAIILLGKVRNRADFESVMNDQRNRSVIDPIFSDWDNFPFEDFVASFPKPLRPFEYNWIYSQLTPEFSPSVTKSQKEKRKPIWDYLEEYKDKIVYDGSGNDMSNGTSWYPDKFWRDEQTH